MTKREKLLYDIKQTQQTLSLNYLVYLSDKQLEKIYLTELKRKGAKK
ncbi:MAG: hypothetical protein AB7V16_14360 [Vulcanibacillus sp.]